MNRKTRTSWPMLFSLSILAAAILPSLALGQDKGGPEDLTIRQEIAPATQRAKLVPGLIGKKETAFSSLEQITFEGSAAAPRFGPRSGRVIFQGTLPGEAHDQIYTVNRDGTERYRASTGSGRAAGPVFLPDGQSFVYASTHLREETPERPKGGGAHPRDFDEAYDLFVSDFRGSILRRLTETPGYDAECSLSPSGKLILWTSGRDGDLEIYRMHISGGALMRVTNSKGYEGGAVFSPDESRIAYHASRTGDGKDLQIYLSGSAGEDPVRLTKNDAVNYAPSFHPDGDRIVFTSNMDDPDNFELYMMKIDGTEVTRITHSPGYDGFPSFSPDGRLLLFSSGRADPKSGDTLVFAADFKPYW
ncbi:MAG: hypothetical protein ABIH26_05135 [Candidatus Eisenbacteria bacterium]